MCTKSGDEGVSNLKQILYVVMHSVPEGPSSASRPINSWDSQQRRTCTKEINCLLCSEIKLFARQKEGKLARAADRIRKRSDHLGMLASLYTNNTHSRLKCGVLP